MKRQFQKITTAKATETSLNGRFNELAPVVQKVDKSIHRINRSPVDKRLQNKPRYPLDRDLSGHGG